MANIIRENQLDQQNLKKIEMIFSKTIISKTPASDFYQFILNSRNLMEKQKLRLIINFENQKGSENGISQMDA